MKIEKIPSAEKMNMEHEFFSAERKQLYSEYKIAQQEAKEYSVIKQNVDALLSTPKESQSEKNIL